MEKTCGNCDKVILHQIMNAVFAGCSITGLVIPHRMDADTRTITYWRIPMECPREDDVLKSKTAASEDEWVFKLFPVVKG